MTLPQLKLSFHGKILDHFGIQMYQSPVASIAELVSNAWDADSEKVEIILPESLSGEPVISIKDNGIGMTLEECEKRYLNVGFCRREKTPNEKSSKGRPILGRKGIGKFAGFGIAEVINIETISEKTGERVVFEMNITELRGNEYISKDGNVTVLDYNPPDSTRIGNHGTTIILKHLLLQRVIPIDSFSKSMARRFLLTQKVDNFSLLINNNPLPENVDIEHIEYSFPKDYSQEELPQGITISDGMGIEKLSNGEEIKWKINFYDAPISEEELRGVAVFMNWKLAQEPFFFQLSGGVSGQVGQEYMSGRVEADYLDQLPLDLNAPERQRINWEHEKSAPLILWGQSKIKELLVIRKKRRDKVKQDKINDILSPFGVRLAKFTSTEVKTVKKALSKLASIEALTNDQFMEVGDGVLSAWEKGRLRDLIDQIADVDNLTQEELLRVLVDAEVITALNTAEVIKTKLDIVKGLKTRIEKRELENAVRDYIAKYPWLISPKWEMFKKETSLQKMVESALMKSELSEYDGRVDLVLSSGKTLLLVEFMRPGLKVDWEHIDRFTRYIDIMRTEIKANTGTNFTEVIGYIVADKISDEASMITRIQAIQKNEMYALNWETLLGTVSSEWQEFLDIFITRSPRDARLAELKK